MERLRPGDPEQIGPWQIVNRLGSGGMGIVYMGTTGTQAAAIKILRDFLLEDPTSKARLGREVASLVKVKSKYVAEIVGADIESNPAWIATNFVDGPSLKTLVESTGPLSEQKWFDLTIGLMTALNEVHRAGVIHRDVKPSNILMSATGPKLIDFGISFSLDATSLTRTGMIAGTPSWFSPEQFESENITQAVDNFAAGSVLYFAATGKNPWGDEDTSIAKVMNLILNRDADMNLLTEKQMEIISALHKKNPKERAKAQDILNKIETYNRVVQYGSLETPAKPKREFKIPKVKVAASLMALALGISAFVLFKPQANAPAAEPTASAKAEPAITKWKLLIVGDTVPQEGTGDKYSTFICDQNVVESSLQVKELTKPASTLKPTATLLKGDKRCGTAFDTILIEGQVDKDMAKRNFMLVGSTTKGFIIQYEFNLSLVN